LESLKIGAAQADGVIHAGFIHDFTRFAEVCEVDKIAIQTIGEVLAGKPFIVTSGTALVAPGKLTTEDIKPPVNPAWPRASEQAGDAFGAAAVHLFPSVHGDDDLHGFVPILVKLAKEKGFSAYIGEGQNRWNAVHRLDAARLFRLALEDVEPGARYHASAEKAISVKSIAEAIGQQLNLPIKSTTAEQPAEHFGWFAHMATIDCPSSSEWTRKQLNWEPKNPTLLTDINNGI
jgi:nucleoside-diphosphate-sugar epimerase